MWSRGVWLDEPSRPAKPSALIIADSRICRPRICRVIIIGIKASGRRFRWTFPQYQKRSRTKWVGQLAHSVLSRQMPRSVVPHWPVSNATSVSSNVEESFHHAVAAQRQETPNGAPTVATKENHPLWVKYLVMTIQGMLVSWQCPCAHLSRCWRLQKVL